MQDAHAHDHPPLFISLYDIVVISVILVPQYHFCIVTYGLT